MFLRQTVIETRKTLAHPALWLGLLGLTLVLAGLMFVLNAQSVWNPGHARVTIRGYTITQAGLVLDLAAGFLLYSWIGSLVCAASAAVIVAYDFPDRSIQVWLTRGLARPTLFFSRLAVVLIFSAALTCFAVLIMVGAAVVARLLFFGQVDAARVNWSTLLPITLNLFWAGLPALAMTVFLAIVSRSPLIAAAGTVIYATLLERALVILIARLPERFSTLIQYLPGQAATILQNGILRLDRAAPSLSTGLSDLGAAWTLALIFLALSGASLIVFNRQDLGG